jgi:hypothetical protein
MFRCANPIIYETDAPYVAGIAENAVVFALREVVGFKN